MGSSYLSNPLVFLIQVLFGLYILVVMLRLLLQLVRADFYNPLSQFIVKVTTPVLHPLRRIVPGVKGIDLSSLLLAWILKSLELFLIALALGLGTNLLAALIWSIPALVSLTLNIFLVALIIQVILSWVNPGGYNPAAALIHALTEPLLGPVRRMIPTTGGLDFSPMLVIIGLVLLKMLLLPPLLLLTKSPFG